MTLLATIFPVLLMVSLFLVGAPCVEARVKEQTAEELH